MEKELAKTLGAAVRAARKARSLTQEDAAALIGISFEFFGRIERGATLPSVPTLARIANALRVSADLLLGLNREDGSHDAVRESLGGIEIPTDDPNLRRLVRRLRKARPRTVRLLGLVAAELEREPRSRSRRPTK